MQKEKQKIIIFQLLMINHSEKADEERYNRWIRLIIHEPTDQT